jgi:flagellar protein FlaG
MNDVKFNLVAQNGSPAGGVSQGNALSVHQPGNSRPSEDSAEPQKIQDRIKSEQPLQAESAKVLKENKDQQKRQVQEAVAKLNDYIQSVQRDLEFNLDEDSGRVVVKVVDRSTNEVVRQIPEEVALKLARNLQSEEPISLLNTKA